MNFKSILSLLVLSAFSLLCISNLAGDEIKLKNGESLNGKITFESDDLVKIEMEVSGTIKQTRTIARSEIEKIVKDAPDNVAFGKLQGLLPTPSLLPASRYKILIETGPVAFLKKFPDSQHAEKVVAMEEELKAELDKVERGFIKVEKEWISPQERAEFTALTDSKIALLNMKTAVRSRSYNGYISALREFEKLEEQYSGTPAFPVALKAAREIIPTFGNQLQAMLRNVEYLNQQYEQNLAAMDEVAKAQVAAARQQEIDNYKAGVAADKDQGIKWVRLDPRSKQAIESYMELAQEELARIQEYDTNALEEQAEILVRADQQAAEGKLDAARSSLKQATAIPVKTSGSSSRTSSRRGSGSYIAAINNKISKKEARAKAEEQAREDALASEALTANLKPGEESENSEEGESTEEGSEKPEEGEGSEASEEKKPVDDFAALANPSKKGNEKEDAKESTKPKTKPKPKEREEEKERPEPVASEPDSGGGIPVTRIIQIATGLLLLTVVALKFLKK